MASTTTHKPAFILTDHAILCAAHCCNPATPTKVWIHDVYDRLVEIESYGHGFLTFARALMRDHRRLLARCDLVQAFDPADVAKSGISESPLGQCGPRIQYHFIRLS